MMRLVHDVLGDVRYALRQMSRTPVITAVAIGVLAIGIGANSAVIAFADGLLKPQAPGVPSKDRLMLVPVVWRGERHSPSELGMDYNELLEFQQRQQVFSEVGAQMRLSVFAGRDITRDRQWAYFVSARYFAAMQPRMALGRAYVASDDRTAAPERSIVVSHRYWRTQLGGDSSVLGTTIFVNSVPMSVIGVLPAGYSPAASMDVIGDLWIPMASRTILFPSDSAFFRTGGQARGLMRTVGLLKPKVTPSVATSSVQAMPPLTTGQREDYIRDARADARALYAPSERDMKSIAQVAAGLTGLSVLFLAIACSNVSILLLGRAVARRREIAVRLSLGAPRRRLVQQLLTESAVLAVVASAAGLAMVRPLSAVLQSVGLEGVGWFALDVNWRVTVGSIAVAIATGIVFGLMPALHATRTSVSDALKQGAAGFDRRRTRLQRGFVVAEVAMSMALVCSAALLLRMARTELSVDPGFDVSPSVLVSELSLEMPRYSPAQTDAVVAAITERFVQLRAIESFGFTSDVPFARRFGWARANLDRGGGGRGSMLPAPVTLVEGDYLRAMGIELEVGRAFDSTDARGAQPVALVSSELAAMMWPGQNAVGQRLSFAQLRGAPRMDSRTTAIAEQPFVVVGVVRSSGPVWQRHSRYELLIPRRQVPVMTDLHVVLRVPRVTPQLVREIATAIESATPGLSFTGLKSTKQYADERPGDAKGLGVGSALAGSVALILACVGMFAVVAFGVAQRARDIGIRLALGATQRTVVGEFFRDGMRLALWGFAIGIPIAIAVMRVLEASDESVRVLGVAPVTAVVGTLLAVAMLAAWIPARRAARVDPMQALRSE